MVDTEPVRIDKDVMNKLRKHIIRKEEDGKVYGKISKTVELAIEEYLENVSNDNKSLAESLRNSTYDTDPDIIDDVLEFLSDSDCLNDNGKVLRQEFWEMYIKG